MVVFLTQLLYYDDEQIIGLLLLMWKVSYLETSTKTEFTRFQPSVAIFKRESIHEK